MAGVEIPFLDSYLEPEGERWVATFRMAGHWHGPIAGEAIVDVAYAPELHGWVAVVRQSHESTTRGVDGQDGARVGGMAGVGTRRLRPSTMARSCRTRLRGNTARDRDGSISADGWLANLITVNNLATRAKTATLAAATSRRSTSRTTTEFPAI